jgi:hypothetical protein
MGGNMETLKKCIFECNPRELGGLKGFFGFGWPCRPFPPPPPTLTILSLFLFGVGTGLGRQIPFDYVMYM